jgi:hypothetical protein
VSDLPTVMTDREVARQRCLNHCLIGQGCSSPAELVTHMGAVQGQEYAHSLWAIGMRLAGDAWTEEAVERAVVDRSIVRVWYMRATLHFVPGPDYRWMMDLKSEQLRGLIVDWATRNGIEEQVFQRANDLLAQVLSGGELTRPELTSVLREAGLLEHGHGPSVIFQRAQVDQVIVQGARKGKQQTFALLDGWLPPPFSRLDADEALGVLARRYFTSHGPATVQDFCRWASVTVESAKLAAERAAEQLRQEVINGRQYWSAPDTPDTDNGLDEAYLLPIYDEYVNGYKDRGEIIADDIDPERWRVFRNTYGSTSAIIIGGMVVGTWRRTLSRRRVHIEIARYHDLRPTDKELIETAAERYGRFLNLPVEVSYVE